LHGRRVSIRFRRSPKPDLLGESDLPGISTRKILSTRDEFAVARILFSKVIGIWLVSCGRWARVPIFYPQCKHPSALRFLTPFMKAPLNSKNLQRTLMILKAEHTSSPGEMRRKIKNGEIVRSCGGLSTTHPSVPPRSIYDVLIRQVEESGCRSYDVFDARFLA